MEAVWQSFVQNILVPLALLVIPALGVWVRFFAKKIGNKILERSKNETSSTIVNNALDQIDNIVDSAVAVNMTLAEKYKEASEDGKLTPEEIEDLQQTAFTSVKNLLPATVTADDVVELLGGKEKLYSIIKQSIEKAVIKFKK